MIIIQSKPQACNAFTEEYVLEKDMQYPVLLMQLMEVH